MKQNKMCFFINFITFALCFFLYLVIGVKACFLFDKSLILTISLIVLGLILNVFLSSLIHELGHIFFGVLCGLKPVSLTVCFIKISFLKSLKIKLVPFNFFGYTEFVPKDIDGYPSKVFKTTLGGVIFSVLFLIFEIILSNLFLSNLVIFTLFGMQYLLTLYLLLINIIPFINDNDGNLLFQLLSSGRERNLIENSLILDALILKGEEPKNINPILLSIYSKDYSVNSVKIIYLRYLSLLEINEEKAFLELEKISNLEKLPRVVYDEILKELFFVAILKKDDIFIAENEDYVLNLLSKEDSPNNYRVHASYRLYKGDNEWAKLIISGGIENLENFAEKGLALTEKRFLLSLKEEM